MWELLRKRYGLKPDKLILLNTEQESASFAGYQVILGDGRKLPFGDKSFDLVFSNSVIEHVGSFSDMEQFASECMRVGKEVYIQTPNRWFPIEPHILTLFIHWLPRPVFHRIAFFSVRYLSLLKNKSHFYFIVNGIRLLTRKEFASLFPGKNLWTERFLGMPKSFVVYDRPSTKS